MKLDRVEDAIEWLIKIEKRAETVYRKALVLFADDPALSKLLGELAGDEEGHYRLITELREGAGLVLPFPDAPAIRKATEAALSSFEQRLSSGLLDRAGLMEAAVALEFSEHNEMFIYMANALRGFPAEFADLVALLGAHRRRITGFLAGKPEFSRALALAGTIPELTKGREILVVEDEETLAGLLRVFLAGEGPIDIAQNGEQALQMLETGNYSAVISDVDMPVMNGIELYLKAEEKFRGIGQKFLFITGSFEEEYIRFFENRGIRYLFKPVSMGDVKKALSLMLDDGEK